MKRHKLKKLSRNLSFRFLNSYGGWTELGGMMQPLDFL